MNKLYSVFAMFLTLVLALLSDRFLQSLRETIKQSLRFDQFIQLSWVTILVTFFFSALLLLLAWFVLLRGERSRIIYVLFIIVGLSLVMTIAFVGFTPDSILPTGELRNTLMVLFFDSVDSFLFRASAFVALIAIAGLINSSCYHVILSDPFDVAQGKLRERRISRNDKC